MTEYTDRYVTIIGMAREGMALARYLSQAGARVTISDRRGIGDLADAVGQLAGLPITCVLRDHPADILDADELFLSPGVPRDIPIVRQAQERGIPLNSLTELFFDLCAASIIGVTGSAGKTTTTTLIGEMLKAERWRKTWVGGNIGHPLIEYVGDISETDYVALELSSFQLEPLRQSPHVAVVTNLRPNHLDRHETFEAYRDAKTNILRFQGENDVAVLNWDDPEVRALAEATPARRYWFSRHERVERGAFVESGWIVVDDGEQVEKLCRPQDLALPGDHNLENVLAAACAARAVEVAGSPIARVATNFSGVEHRLELVRTYAGVRWYNDSIATSPDRTVAALRAFDQNRGQIVLLAGGRDKHLPMDEMVREILVRVKHLVLFGEMASTIESAVKAAQGDRQQVAMDTCHTLEEAVTIAANVAEVGDIVLLSPSGTSFDAFKDFAERGDRFKELVRDLSNQTQATYNGHPLRVAVN